MNWLKRETTMPKRSPCALILPSMALCFGLAGCSIFTLLFYHGGTGTRKKPNSFHADQTRTTARIKKLKNKRQNNHKTPCLCALRRELPPFEVRLPLFQERCRSLFFVFGGAGDGKQSRF